ncbi:MAG: peptide ABC transporter substrate-binding protein [Thermoleophilia bacterium]|jgi:oligopeptide transport system substrate-binding protein
MLRKNRWLHVILVLALTGAFLTVAGCGGGGKEATNAGGRSAETSAAEQPVPGGTLSVCIAEVSFIDPLFAFESEGLQVVQALFEGLTRFDYKTSVVEPCVAESWDVNADATVFTFHLKKGTRFHNGREVVAADFKYQWERLSNPVNGSMYSSLLSMVKGFDAMQDGTDPATTLSGVKVLDDYTLEVTMAYPFAEFPYVVGFPDTAPVPKEEVEKDPEAFKSMPVGNGPFKMAEPWKAGHRIKVVKFDGYAGTKPHIDGIDFLIYSDPNTAFLDFKAGTLDWTQIPTGQYKSTLAQYGASDDGVTANPGKQVQNGQELGVYEVIMNNEDAVFKNADLRRAVSLAINRQAVCDVAFEGLRKPATSIIPSGLPGHEANAWQYNHYDPAAAKEMLAKAGYPNGQGLPTLRLGFNSGAGHEQAMQMIQADLKAVGIRSEFEISDAPTYWDKVEKGTYQIGRSGWQVDYPTIDNVIYPLFFSTAGQNFSKYNNPAVDKAILAARQIPDEAERTKAMQAVVKLIGDDQPEIAICTYAHQRVASDRVHDLVYSPIGYLNFVDCWISE